MLKTNFKKYVRGTSDRFIKFFNKANASDNEYYLYQKINNILQIYSTTVKLTQSQMETLGTVPVVVVPAPGVGKHLLYIAGSAEVYSGTTDWNESGAWIVSIGVDGANGVGRALTDQVGTVNQFLPQTGGMNANNIKDNTAFYIQNGDGDLTGGDKLYQITIYYAII